MEGIWYSVYFVIGEMGREREREGERGLEKNHKAHTADGRR